MNIINDKIDQSPQIAYDIKNVNETFKEHNLKIETPTITPSTTNGSQSSEENSSTFDSVPSVKSEESDSNLPPLKVSFNDSGNVEITDCPSSLERNQIGSAPSSTKPNVKLLDEDKIQIRPPFKNRSQSYMELEISQKLKNFDDRITGMENIATATAASFITDSSADVMKSKISRHNTFSVNTSKNISDSTNKKGPHRRFTRTKSKKEVPLEDLNLARYGTRVGEEHNNYELMYNMLTGIRVSVSRCTAKTKRPLTRADFTAANKLAFDITGNELTPSSKYDFKFKDYSPWVFRALRELFGIDPAEYLLSLTLKYILSELNTPGKSGSFFYYSQDFRFIIKTLHHSEHKFFRKILPSYYEHVKANTNTLISRIYGLHRVKMPSSKKIHFVVMANVLPPTKDIHAQFDLKGSTFGRYLDEKQATETGLPVVLKDLNWIKQGRKLELGPQKRHILFQQLSADVDFLARNRIMDYSLLIGIHNMERGNRDKLRQATLMVFDPMSKATAEDPRKYTNPSELKLKVATADPVSLDETPAGISHQLPDEVSGERKKCIFYRDFGGFLATDEDDNPSTELYCMGIIDIMTPYSLRKRFEHAFKSLGHNDNEISCVDPITYAHRFLSFITKAIKNKDDLEPLLQEYAASHPSKYHAKTE